jgi:alcohol dehydrogenase (cytochrome c)
VADGDTIFVQDLRSNVYALDRKTGKLRWEKLFHARNDGPNGLAVADGRVYGATDTDTFALDERTGEQLWTRHLTGPTEQFVDIAPIPWKDMVFVSTIGYPRGGRGELYGLDRKTGEIRWSFNTIKEPWKFPMEAGGGGVWQPVSVDDHGLVYAGNSNPSPWGGTPEKPNGGSYPGPVLYTDSLLVLDGRTGRLEWYDQVTPHDIRDYDFQLTPVLVDHDGRKLVVGAGKGGRVIAWDRKTHERVWNTAVGLHVNDVGPLKRRKQTVCPGLLGGVETPLAYEDGRVFVPVVDLCVRGNSIGTLPVTEVNPLKGRGRMVALDVETGARLWERRLASPDFGCAAAANGVVFTSTYDGRVYGFRASDGSTLWQTRLRAGSNSCPSVDGDLLLVGGGVRLGRGSVPELVAYGP